MNKIIGKSMKAIAAGALLVLSGTAIISCNDEIELKNRFTFTGELIANHLQNNPQYSNFCTILEKAKIGKKSSGSILKTLSTYGSYTCFAPTNSAVEAHLTNEYNRYIESIEQNRLDPTIPVVNTGITSPLIEELSDSMATEIAKNHIIEMGYQTTDINEGAFPMSTMNRRFTTVEWITDDNGRVFALLNNSARIIEPDLKMENGYIQAIDGVLAPSSETIAGLVSSQSAFSIFNEGLKLTGLDELLSIYDIDPSYDGTLYGPPFETQAKQQPPYPAEKHQRFTLLIESNDLLADPSKNPLNKPILNINDLIELAEYWYDTEDRDNPTSKKNALYQFIAYHIIDRQLLYSSSTGPGGFIMENYDHKDFNSEVNLPRSFDRYDYFETYLPYTMIKVTKPFTNEEYKQEIVINYAQDMGTRCNRAEMKHHINVIVERASTTKQRPGLEDFNQNALNGIIHTIDRILIYNEDEMTGNILKERMRWDALSIFPELTNNGVRWAQQDEYTLTYIPNHYSSRLKINNTNTDIYYLRPHSTGLGGYVNYMGDELLVTGKYDFEYRLPYVPAGNYEIRFGFGQSDARGVAQFYLDGKICGIPVDMRNTAENQTTIGWFDEEGMSEEEIKENDKAMRNRGFMKAPASCHLTKEKNSMRESVLAIRKIVGTFRLDKGDHWLRFKDVMENSTGKLNEFNQDYLEIVPTTVISDPSKPEDQN